MLLMYPEAALILCILAGFVLGLRVRDSAAYQTYQTWRLKCAIRRFLTTGFAAIQEAVQKGDSDE